METIIKNALNKLEEACDGHLLLGERHLIWNSFGPIVRDAPALARLGSKGHTIRAHLAVLCVEQVLPFWQNLNWDEINEINTLDMHFSKDMVGDLLNCTKLYLEGKMDWDSLGDLTRDGEEEVDHLNYVTDGIYGETNAGLAAVRAAQTAMQDEEFDANDIDPNLDDCDIEPSSLDASMYAALAYQHCAISISSDEFERERAFWRWYLCEAIPKVLQQWEESGVH